MRRLFALVLLSSLLLPPVHAAPPSAREIARHGDAVLAKQFADDGFAVSVLVMRGDTVLYRGARGRASIALDVPATPDHVFRIGSITKQMSAAAILKLAEDGKLTLDDPVTRFVPGYPNGDAITVRMLLDHTSGIRSYTDIPATMSGGIMRTLTTAELVDTFKDEPIDFAPGAQWKYNNSAYVLVGAVIEAASGQPWHVYLQQVFFGPLGMAHTGYGDESVGVIPGHVSGYTRVDDRWAAAKYLSMSQPHAAGALVSTVDDLARWSRALHGGRVLKPASWQRMTTPGGAAASARYGLGIERQRFHGRDMFAHGGGIFGFNSYLMYLPEEQLTVAVLEATDDVGPGGTGATRLAHLLAAHALGRAYPEKTPITVAPDALADYTGVYRMDPASTRVVRLVDGQLTSQRTGGQTVRLIPTARDTFMFDDGWSVLVFERGGDGKVTGMRLSPEDGGDAQRTPRTDEALPNERVAAQLPDALARLAGRYTGGGMQLAITVQDGHAMAQLARQPAFEVFAESPTTFFLKAVDATLEIPAGTTPAKTVTLRQAGMTLPFERTGD